MVALSLYRGNMHRVSDAPRRWLMPDQNIPFKGFKALHNRRLVAFSRLQSKAATVLNPNPNLTHGVEIDIKEGTMEMEQEKLMEGSYLVAGDRGVKERDGRTRSEKEVGGSCSMPGSEAVVVDRRMAQVDVKDETQANEAVRTVENAGQKLETNGEVQETSDKEKKIEEIEAKLQALKTKKHGLVQMLKQILNAEEEMKRRSTCSIQASVSHSMPTLHVELHNDPDPASRHDTPRTGSEANRVTDMEGLEACDASSYVAHTRPFHRMSSMSPSSESTHRRLGYLPYNTVPHPSRATFGATSPSPSRFAPTPPQGQSSSFPLISVCTTNYVGSLPSPAASGGTPIFRDNHHPSPWS